VGTPTETEEVEVVSRRISTRSAAAVLALAVGGVGAVVPAAYGAPPGNGGQWTHAYQSTVGAKTAAMSEIIKEQLKGHTITITATGDFDWSRSIGHTLVSVSVPGAAAEKLNEVVAGSNEYVEFPPAIRSVLSGKAWVEVPIGSAGSNAETENPTTLLAILEAGSSAVRRVGTARLDGVQTTIYTATIDPSQDLQHLSPQLRKLEQQSLSQFAGTTSVPVELWVDGQGRVRQLVEHATLTPKAESAAAAAGTIRMVVTVGLSHYGLPVSVTIPPASQVSHKPLSQVLDGTGSQTD
jgi:hypothetical protein